MSSDLLEKKFKLAAEQPIPQPPDLDKLAFFLQGGDDLLRDDVLGNKVRKFREALDERFQGTNSEVYATVDKDWIQYYLFDLGWNVYHDVIRDYYWGYREKDKEPVCGRDRLGQLLFDDIERIRAEEEDAVFGVDRDPVLRKIVDAVFVKVGRNRVKYRLRDPRENDMVIFTLEGNLRFSALRNGTFSSTGLHWGSLDEVIDQLDNPEIQQIITKINRWQEEQKKQAAEKEFWSTVYRAASRLDEILAARKRPTWGPDTNTRGFYFGLDTLCSHAKAKAEDPLLNLEKAVVNEFLKEMVDFPTPEIVRKLELVSRLAKESEQ
jgi:hypothetical protein